MYFSNNNNGIYSDPGYFLREVLIFYRKYQKDTELKKREGEREEGK